MLGFNLTDKIRRNVLIATDHGPMIVNRFDCNHEQVGHGQWLLDHGSASSVEAYETYQAIRHIENPVIFDVGSNIGTYTTWLAKLLPQGTIYCFEPQRLVFQILCGNLAINNLDNCHTYNLALGAEDTSIVVEEPDYGQQEDFGIFSLVEDKVVHKSGRSLVVQIKTIDNFMREYKVDKLDLVKIDVEGMDIQVLKGARSSLAAHRPVIFIEHSDNRRSTLSDIVDWLGIDNYSYKVVGNNLLAKPKGL